MNLPRPIDIYCENGRLGMRGPLEAVRARRRGGYGTVRVDSLLTYCVNTKETTACLRSGPKVLRDGSKSLLADATCFYREQKTCPVESTGWRARR